MNKVFLTSVPVPHRMAPEPGDTAEYRNSGFVKLSSGSRLDIRMKYSEWGLDYAVQECYIREEAALMLDAAANRLPDGMGLRVWDAWRPFELQKLLYERYSVQLMQSPGLAGMTIEEQQREIVKCISYPERCRERAPVHTTGGAVDLTLITKDGSELDMGTGFDDFSGRADTDYYEIHTNESAVIRDNRRILYNAMIGAGFTNLPSEWWHYDYGDRFWSYYTAEPAMYKGVFSVKELYMKEN